MGIRDRVTTGMIEAVLFDIGGTLIHFETSHPRRLLAAAARPAYDRLSRQGHNLPPFKRYEQAVWRRFVRSFVWARVTRRESGLLASMRTVHRRLGIPLGDEALRSLLNACTPAIKPFFAVDAEARAALERTHRSGLKLGVVSNTFFPASVMDAVLDGEGILEYLPVRVYSSDVRYMKPHPEIFRMALARMQVPPARAVYVGDRIAADVKGPAKLGMKTVFLARDRAVPHGRIRPDRVIRCLSELPVMFEEGLSDAA